MTLLAAKVIWLLGVIGWFIIRYPHDRRARRTPKLRRADRGPARAREQDLGETIEACIDVRPAAVQVIVGADPIVQ